VLSATHPFEDFVCFLSSHGAFGDGDGEPLPRVAGADVPKHLRGRVPLQCERRLELREATGEEPALVVGDRKPQGPLERLPGLVVAAETAQ
jgi:hypothetical protein